MPNLPSSTKVGGLQPETCGQNPIVCGGGAASLDMAERGDARLEPGAGLDLGRQRPPMRQPRVTKGIGVPPATTRLSPLSNWSCQPSLTTTIEKSLPRSCRRYDQLAAALDGERLLGDQDHVRAGRPCQSEARSTRRAVPSPRTPSRDRAIRRSSAAVDCLGCDRQRGIEPKRRIGTRKVVVDRLSARRRSAPDARRGGGRRRRGYPRRRSRPARPSRPGRPAPARRRSRS